MIEIKNNKINKNDLLDKNFSDTVEHTDKRLLAH